MNDFYISTFSVRIKRLEECYGLRSSAQFCQLKMSEFKPQFEAFANGLSKEDLKQRNQTASADMAIIAYMNARLKFYGQIRLNYTKFKRINEIVRILIPFCNSNGLTVQDKLRIGELCLILSEIDEENPAIMNSLAYMYLRMLVVLVLCENYCDASIIADLVLSQLVSWRG